MLNESSTKLESIEFRARVHFPWQNHLSSSLMVSEAREHENNKVSVCSSIWFIVRISKI